MRRHGFTLIEVAVASTLIAFAVLSALAIIPQGLKAQQHARMKAVAAATAMTLFATASGWDGTTGTSDFTSTPPTSLLPWVVTGYVLDTGDDLPETPGQFYRWNAPASDLANRIAFTFYGTGNETVHVARAWELRADPASGSTAVKAFYLASFTYYLP